MIEDQAAAIPAVILAVIAWVLHQLLNGGPAIFPPEIGRAFVQFEKTAIKWEEIGKLITDGGWLVVLLAGVLAGLVLRGKR